MTNTWLVAVTSHSPSSWLTTNYEKAGGTGDEVRPSFLRWASPPSCAKGKREQPTNTTNKKPRFCLKFFRCSLWTRSIIFLCRNYFEEWGDGFSLLNWKENVGFWGVWDRVWFIGSFGHWFLAVNQSFVNHLSLLFSFQFHCFGFAVSFERYWSLASPGRVTIVWVGLMTCQSICLCMEQA